MTIRVLALTIIAASLIRGDARGDDSAEKRSPLKTLWVKVTDPDGKPVGEAQVKPWAQRFGNAHGTWPQELAGEPKLTVTDDDGRTSVDYPPSIGGEAVTTVSLFVDHPDFCVRNVDVSVAGTKESPAPVALERGTILRIQTIEAGTLQPIVNPYIQFLSHSAVRPIDGSGHFRKADGEAGDSGWYESRRLPREASRLYVVSIRDDDVPMFSRLHRWRPEDPISHLIIASVDIGVRFEGTIDPAVPRPIKNGRVVGCATIPPDDANQGGSTIWTDIVPINEDGSFVFPSMPRDCDLQIVSLCDGWRSDLPTAEDVSRMVERYGGQANSSYYFSAPQSWKLDGDVVSGTVKMIRTGSCRIRCLKPDGSPVAGVQVGFSPNHFFYGAGSQIFAVSNRTAEYLKNRPMRWPRGHDYLGTTDENGWATISNLPPGPNGFGVRQHRFAKSANRRDESIVIEVDKVAEMTVTIEPQPN